MRGNDAARQIQFGSLVVAVFLRAFLAAKPGRGKRERLAELTQSGEKSVKRITLGLTSALTALGAPAMAQTGPLGPIEVADGVTLDPILDARIRLETVDQGEILANAEALTARLRAGFEAKADIVSFLAEAEGTLALIDDYNDTIPSNGIEPFPVVPDPETLELNRLQLSVMREGTGAVIGRQRIIHGNSRFIGNVGWRQNEQTFDAVRGLAKIGPVSLDATYAISQRTIFGSESPNEHLDGDFVFLIADADIAGVDAGLFTYLIDYDARDAFSSQTYGLQAAVKVPLPGLPILAEASFATQSDYGSNPVEYTAEFISLRLTANVAGFGVTTGYEELGSDDGIAAFQTPMATLHAFQGWADIFLVTPAGGVRDYNATASYNFGEALPVEGLKAAVTYHRFDSDFGGVNYGTEWDASLGFKVAAVAVLAKYANYSADAFAVDTEKFWLQAEVSF